MVAPYVVSTLTYTVHMEIRDFPRDEWPVQLSEIPQLPEKLWIRGTMPAPGTKLLTVVGSRALSRYGQEACDSLIAGLAGYPISIVSGLALGTDACAHRAALRTGLHTIAIPGSGLDDSVIGPRTNLGLAKDILASGGALLSEQEPLHKPWLKEFPSRNRIMVGMSDAVLIIEASSKSGTLITARMAVDYNRELLCVPHRIGDPHGFGPHLFARLGAALVTEPLHILEALKIPPREGPSTGVAPRDLEDAEVVIWHMLEEPKTRDEILRAASGGAGDTLTALVSLELRGLIKEEFGAWHRL
jgi:DNA processing protein